MRNEVTTSTMECMPTKWKVWLHCIPLWFPNGFPSPRFNFLFFSSWLRSMCYNLQGILHIARIDLFFCCCCYFSKLTIWWVCMAILLFLFVPSLVPPPLLWAWALPPDTPSFCFQNMYPTALFPKIPSSPSMPIFIFIFDTHTVFLVKFKSRFHNRDDMILIFLVLFYLV